MKTTAKRRKKTRKPCTKGELNKLIDSLIHPLSEADKRYLLVDGLLHGLVEQDPPQTVRKFIKYNLPEILKQRAQEALKKTFNSVSIGTHQYATNRNLTLNHPAFHHPVSAPHTRS